MSLFEDYEINEEISVGGFGRIYKAKHKLLQTPACIKQNRNASADDVKLLMTEGRLLWMLDEYHSIPSAKGFYKLNETTAALVTSFIDGETLEDMVRKNGRMHPEDVSWIAERLLGALYYAHSYGVVHSDIKPGNIIIEERKHDIKLIDWGLAIYRPNSSTMPTGSTPAYAAPELASGRPPIPETDIYGAGVSMLYALGGDVLARSIPNDVPEKIAEFAHSLMRYDPKERPNWDKQNLIETLSDIRLEAFGRRHISHGGG